MHRDRPPPAPTAAGSRFPDPRSAPADAPLAVGGDLRPATLMDAYRHGIFPWPTGSGSLLWWSPDPRMVIPLDGLHVSRSLQRTLRRGTLRCGVDGDLEAVIRACADRPGQGTWITPAMRRAYVALGREGAAHSVEVRDAGGALVGGVYGVAIGGAFMGESMFSRVADASKVALVGLVAQLRDAGFALLDVQLPTPHLASMGGVEVPRGAFLDALASAVALPVRFGRRAGDGEAQARSLQAPGRST